jgi:hypothetical protein
MRSSLRPSVSQPCCLNVADTARGESNRTLGIFLYTTDDDRAVSTTMDPRLRLWPSNAGLANLTDLTQEAMMMGHYHLLSSKI